MSLRVPSDMVRFWSSTKTTDWPADGRVTRYNTEIWNDEELTIPTDLSGVNIFAIIRDDLLYGEVLSRTARTRLGNNVVEFTLPASITPRIGDWKMEFWLYKNSVILGITHHEDFNVMDM